MNIEVIKYSLIIPTFNRYASLRKCLSSILQLNDKLSDVEIIVVDDGSSDDTEEIVIYFKEKFNQFVYYSQKNKGPAAARNKGAELSKGEYIIFIDDDCTVTENWLSSVKKFYYVNPEASGVGGKIINIVKNDFSEFSQRFGDFLVSCSKEKNMEVEYIVSCNSSFKKNDFLEIKGFDEKFIWAGAEDRDLCLKLKERGHKIYFDDDIVAYNNCELNLIKFFKQHVTYGKSAAHFYGKNKKLAVGSFSQYIGMVRNVCIDRDPIKRSIFFIIFIFSQACAAIGFLYYNINYHIYKRPHFVFMPKMAIICEILKNFVLKFSFLRLIKQKIGLSMTTGEELFSEGYLSRLANRTYDTYAKVIKEVAGANFILREKNILVIGPGSHLGVPLLFATAGANKVVAIDRFGEVKFQRKEISIYEKIENQLPKEAQNDMEIILNEMGTKNLADLNCGPINYFPNLCIENKDICSKLPENFFNLIVSYNTLEHVKDLEGAFYNMKKLLKSDGLCIHRIDAGTHYAIRRYTKNDFSHFVFSDTLFNAMFSNKGAPNRKILKEYTLLAERHGFKAISLKVDECAKVADTREVYNFFDRKFRKFSYEDISPIRFIIVMDKKER